MLVVLVVCVSPAVDLPESALRAKQAAVRIAMAIIAFAMVLASMLFSLPLLERLPNSRSELVQDLFLADPPLPLLC